MKRPSSSNANARHPQHLARYVRPPTRHVHSRYRRVVRDLPINGKAVVLLLHIHKFYCKEPACPRRVEASRLPQLTPPHGQHTAGLRLFLATLGREAGGAGGARIAAGMGLQVTSRTLLRVLHAQPLSEPESPRIIGLDDWAWKKRSRYGAIVVDLERGRPIALLEQRSVAVVAAWLRKHPTIEVVARDRSEEFAAAIREALPQAVQVADRFHLISNLVEHLDRLVVLATWVIHAKTCLVLATRSMNHTLDRLT